MPTAIFKAEHLEGLVLVHSEHCIEARIGEEVVMMDAEQGFCFGLDTTGSFIWEQLKTPISVPALIQSCSDHFDAPEGTIEEDVKQLLLELLAKKLIISSVFE
ncbi:PqqD family protein [Granulicella paludicola]|uniref:PqqD family protein n=1 Tax=Granulicella paludicola TaxID=474951 RepID=UPI0021E09DA2|nr:PqqD family protein [Granulicella paludicola]